MINQREHNSSIFQQMSPANISKKWFSAQNVPMNDTLDMRETQVGFSFLEKIGKNSDKGVKKTEIPILKMSQKILHNISNSKMLYP